MPRIPPRPSRRPAIARAYPGMTLVAPFLGPGKAVGSDGGDVRVIGSAGNTTGTRTGSGFTFADSPFGKSLQTPGGTNYASIANGPKPTTQATVGAWLIPTSLASGGAGWNKAMIFPYGASSWTAPYQSYAVGANNSSPMVAFGMGSDYTKGLLISGTPYILNALTYVVGTFSNGIVSLYVNGKLDSSQDFSSYGTSIIYTTRTTLILGLDAEYQLLEAWAGYILASYVLTVAQKASAIATNYDLGPAAFLAPSGDSYYDAGLIRNYARGILTLDCGN